MEKKAQGLSINAVILIILGIAVLVILAFGFIAGWDKLSFWIPSNNVDTIVKACESACSSQAIYDYCSVTRELKTQDGKYQNITCYTLAYADGLSKYGIKKCSSINCKDSVKCLDWKYDSPTKKGESVIITENGNPVTASYCLG
jgi:hypothetical protein